MWKTRDIYLAATLITLNYPIKRITTSDGKAYFWFEKSDQISVAKKLFWEERHRVEPRRLLNNLKGLKGRIYELLEKK